MISFFAAGIPATKGSTKSFALKKGGVYTGRVATMNDSKRTKPWMGVVATAAHGAGVRPVAEGVRLHLSFFLPRPAGHFGSGKNAGRVLESAPVVPITCRADLDKMIRCVLDALIGVAFNDDGQVVSVVASKAFADDRQPPGARVRIDRFAAMRLEREGVSA